MANPTYKHLESKLRLGALSVGQWFQLLLSALGGLVFAFYLSPFSIGLTIFVSLLGAGFLPAVSYGAMHLEFSMGELFAAGVRFYRSSHRFMPGPGRELVGGYRIELATPEPAGPSKAHRPRKAARATDSDDTRENDLWDF